MDDFRTVAFGLSSFYNKKQLADVTFLVQEKEFYAHKVVLSARSRYFRDFFEKSASKEGQVIQVPTNVLPETFAAVLYFIYTDKARVPFDIVALHQMLELAQLYKLPLLEYYVTPKYKKAEKAALVQSGALERTLWSDLTALKNLDQQSIGFSDIAIHVDGHLFNCHKVVLAARCTYFDRMFRWQWRESSQESVVINDIPKDLFEVVLLFIYQNELELESIHDTLELYKLAEFFQMDSLIVYCEEFILAHAEVTLENVSMLWNCADKLKADNLFVQCKNFMVQNFVACSEMEDFLKLDKPLLKAALNSGEIDADENALFRIIERWGKAYLQLHPDDDLSLHDVIGDLLPPLTMFNSKLRSALLLYGKRTTNGVPDIRNFL